MFQCFTKPKKGARRIFSRPVLAAVDKVPCERVFLWGDSNLRDLVRCDAGIDLLDAIADHLVRAQSISVH